MYLPAPQKRFTTKLAMTMLSADPQPSVRRRLLVVAVFAVAMAWVEAAVVFYLRRLVDRIEPYQPNPLPIAGDLGGAELVREAATLVMLLAVGWLAGRAWRTRLGFFLAAFGVWDIFYYVFLRAMTGWPHSLFDWDVLFLIPLPWWEQIPRLRTGYVLRPRSADSTAVADELSSVPPLADSPVGDPSGPT